MPRSKRRPQVFIARDFMLDPLLGEIESALRSEGIDVIRGPESHPGEKLTYPPERFAELFGSSDVLMFSSRSVCSREVLQAATRARAVINPSIGMETVDLQAADELAIIVGHGPVPENYQSMAEAAVMLMLNLRYNLKVSEGVLRGTHVRPPPLPALAHARMLRGATIAIIGLGRIARATIELLAPFHVDIVAYSPNATEQNAPPGVTLVSFDAAMAAGDIVLICAAANATNRGLIDERALGLMKATAYLINIARGELVDEDALYVALKERRIAGAALDTFMIEPLPQHSPLRALDNAILTPHIIGHTREVFQALVPAAVENIKRVLRGEPPLYCKNPEVIGRWRERLKQLERAERQGI